MNMLGDGLRGFVDGVERDVVQVSQGASPPDKASVDRLVRSWGRLVDFLALGPAPELRDCPHCGASGMRAATRCGRCWQKLVPPDPRSATAA
jgi:hypothetical protein